MGGRGSKSTTATASGGGGATTPQAQQPPQQQAVQATPMTPQQQAQNLQQAAAQNATPPATINDNAMSQADINRLVASQNAYMQQNPDADIARGLYISAANAGGGYSMSQNLNYKLEHGGTLNGNESFIYQNLRGSMQQIGADVTLNRGAHADVVQSLGVSNWSNMSASQLQQALVGKSWTSNSFTSCSYDQSKNPFFNGPNSGGREVVLRMHTSGQTRAMLGARKQTELVLDIGTNFRVTNVGYTGRTATPRNGSPTRQIVLDVNVW